MTERLTFTMADSVTLISGAAAALVSFSRLAFFGADLVGFTGLLVGLCLVAWSLGWDAGLRLFFFHRPVLGTAVGTLAGFVAGYLAAVMVHGFLPPDLDLAVSQWLTLSTGVTATSAFLVAGILSATWRTTALKTPLVPAAVFVALATASACLCEVVAQREDVRTRAALNAEISGLRDEVHERIQFELAPIVRLVNQYEAGPRLDREKWEESLKAFLADCPACEKIVWRDGLLRTRWDSSGTPTADLSRNQRELYLLVRQLGRSFLLRDPERSSHEVVFPLMPGKWYDGYLTLELRARDWLEGLLGEGLLPGFAFQIREGTRELFARAPAEFDRDAFFAEAEPLALEMFGSNWEIRVLPLPSEIARRTSSAAWFLLLVGFLFSVTFAGLAHAVLIARVRASQQARVNIDLAESEARYRRQAEENEQAHERIASILRSKTEFLEAVSRELVGLASALAPKAAPHEKKRKKSRKASNPADLTAAVATVQQRLTGLAAEVRDLAGISEGRYESQADALNLRELVESAFGVLRPLAQASGAKLQLAMPSSFPSGLKGDRERMNRALIHAGQEAIDAAGTGQITVLADVRFDDRRAELYFQVDIVPEAGRHRSEPLGGKFLAESLEGISGHVIEDSATRLVFAFPLKPAESAPPADTDSEIDLEENEEDALSERLIQLISEEIPIGFERIRSSLITDEWAGVRQNCQILVGALEELGAEDVLKLLKPLSRWSPEDGAASALSVLAAVESAFDDFCDQMERESLRISRAA